MPVTRRAFAGAVTAASYQRVKGANDRVQVGFIGYGLIGAQHVEDFRTQRDAELAAVAEAYQPRLEQGVAACGGRARGYRDFRRLLDDREIQAVVISTPDHWHALMTMMACAAGKDVYVEKPLSLFVREGRWMTAVARRHGRVVQVGTQQRSGPHYHRAMRLLREGHLGKVHHVRAASIRNVMPGFGAPADGESPAGLDYDLWLGPAPARPYNPQRSLYHFRWFWDYSGGQMTNLGAHEIDIAQWFLGAPGPAAVSSSGGRFCLRDNGETPDTQDALFEYPGFTMVYSLREASAGRRAGAGLEFFGDKGSLTIGRTGFEVHPDPRIDPASAIPVFAGHPAGGPRRQNHAAAPWTQPVKDHGSSEEQFERHARNFLDCVKSRQRPVADVEDGHRTAAACHLANISLRTGRKIRWDADREEILDDREAAAMLERPYRPPWDAVARSLIGG
jgi:predicted dehydrogenase